MFEDELLVLEEKVKNTTNNGGCIAFYGSSSVRLWSTLNEDLKPLNTINLGFGGATIPDCIAQAERVLFPLSPRKIIFYIGDNDIGNGSNSEEVFKNFNILYCKAKKALPNTLFTYVSIKPSPQRNHLRGVIEEANNLVSALAKKEDRLEFVDIYNAMLNDDNSVNASLFVEDQLHLNDTGYKLWTRLFREALL